jgi:hypothetical protein
MEGSTASIGIELVMVLARVEANKFEGMLTLVARTCGKRGRTSQLNVSIEYYRYYIRVSY